MTPCYECGLLSTRAPAGATQISALARGLIGKIKRAARDMEELIDALLLLARECIGTRNIARY